VPVSATPGPGSVRAFDPAGAAATATFTVQTSWATARFSPTGSGFNPQENVLTPADVSRLRQVAEPQWGAFLHSEPIYVSGLLIAGSSDGTVREFNPGGDQRWSFTARGPVLGSPVAVFRKAGQAPCAIAVGSSGRIVYGLNPRRGTRIWTLHLGGPASGSLAPAVQFGPDLVGVSDGGAIAVVNGCTGTTTWGGTLALGSAPREPETPVVLPHVTLRNGKVRTIIVVSTAAGTSGLNADGGTLI
jgi:outer membrane protein assembly factor BamB